MIFRLKAEATGEDRGDPPCVPHGGHSRSRARGYSPSPADLADLEATLLYYGVHLQHLSRFGGQHAVCVCRFDSVERWEAVAQTDVCRRWWAHMRELMQSNPDNSPIATPLDEVFHIDEG